MRRQLTNILKICITLLGLIFVLTRFDLRVIGATLQQTDPVWLLVGFILVNASVVLRAYRWLLLIRGLHAQVPFRRLVELYYVGSFFNVFLPSGFGGDVVRVLEVSRDIPAEIATGTVIVDRMTGLMMLFALALLSLPFRPPDFPPQLLRIIVTLSVGGLIAGFVLLDGRLLLRISHKLPQNLMSSGNGFLLNVTRAVEECGWRAIGGAMLVSLLFNLLQAVWWTTSAYALGLVVPFGYMLLVVPILSLALLIPSIGGLGVREFLAPVLFSGAGLTPEEAIALTLLVFLLERVSGLLGGPVYIYTILRDRKKQSGQEEGQIVDIK
jgi:glycosyltransferase 2 family protein